MKQRESVKMKERLFGHRMFANAKNAQKEPRDQHQSCHSMRLHALFATDSLEQNWFKQPSTNTQSHMNMYVRI